jgi:hypothetical protein
MRRFIQVFIVGVVFLLLGMNVATAQEVTYGAGPTVTLGTAGSNGGFTWGDVDGDGILDVFVRQNNLLINSGSAFTLIGNTGLPGGGNVTALGFADFNGDGLVDVYEIMETSLLTNIYINNGNKTYTLMANSGDLATAGGNSFGFNGIGVADINHSNYLTLAWPGQPSTGIIAGSGANSTGGGGIWLLKGGPSGFTNVGRGATSSAIDTALTYESWGVAFFDANGDGYPDLLIPSYRNGIQRYNVASASGSRKGSVLFINDGTGKFNIPNATTLGRPIYEIDSVVSGVVYAGTTNDMGVVVDDTVRHFGGLAHIVGDFNNDGIMDLFFCSNGAENLNALGVWGNVALIYGLGDGTFTYKYNGAYVANGIPNTYIRAWNAGDYNNDGKLDIVTADGTNTLLRNNGDGTFTNVTATDGLTGAALGFRAAAFVDYNKDGWLDIYSYTGGTSTLLKSTPGTNTNKWLGIIPTGAGKNQSAIGALFTVYSGTAKQIRLIASEAAAGGWGGNLWANFGLGTGTIDSVSCVWPDGLKQTWPGAAITINSYNKIVEGSVYFTTAPTTSRPSWAAGDSINMPSANTFKWNSISGGTVAVKYRIQIGTSKAMSSILQDFTALTDTFKVTKVPLASKLFWRVAGLSGNFQGVWSAVDSLRTNMTPATTVPIKLSPTTNQLHLPLKPTLVCSSTPEAYIYHFQLDTLNRFAVRDTTPQGAAKYAGLLFNDSTTVTDTFKVMSALTPNRIYYWRVRAWNAAGASAYSPVDSFTIQYLPLATKLVYPTHNQADARADTLVFNVQKVDADSMYVFQSWTYTSAGQAFRSDTVKQNPSLTLTGLINRARYYWKVQVGNQAGWSAFTAVDSFTTVIELPSVPLAISPKNSTAEPRKTTFVWRKATNAVWYHLQVGLTTNFNNSSDVLEDVMVEKDTTYTIKDTLLAATLYYWHVSSVNLGGETSFSTLSKFTSGYGVTSVSQPIAEIPKNYSLQQNYPNPFNPSTTISYDLPATSVVKVYIYDVLGRVVANLADGVQSANRYTVQWNASNMSSGVYFYRIDARGQDGSNFTSVKKLLLMK